MSHIFQFDDSARDTQYKITRNESGKKSNYQDKHIKTKGFELPSINNEKNKK